MVENFCEKSVMTFLFLLKCNLYEKYPAIYRIVQKMGEKNL